MARILVIEDNPDNMELVRYLLQEFGHVVLSAIDGETGEKIAREQCPDLIICDVQLPGIDGCDLIRRFKNDAVTSKIPVVAVTAMAMVGDRDKVLASGFDGYIAKPIVPEIFVGQIESLMIT